MGTDLLCMRLCSELRRSRVIRERCKAEVGLSIWSSVGRVPQRGICHRAADPPFVFLWRSLSHETSHCTRPGICRTRACRAAGVYTNRAEQLSPGVCRLELRSRGVQRDRRTSRFQDGDPRGQRPLVHVHGPPLAPRVDDPRCHRSEKTGGAQVRRRTGEHVVDSNGPARQHHDYRPGAGLPPMGRRPIETARRRFFDLGHQRSCQPEEARAVEDRRTGNHRNGYPGGRYVYTAAALPGYQDELS